MRTANEPDGAMRCFGHSLDPANVLKRQMLAEKGRAAGERMRGVAKSERKAVIAGVVPIERARATQAAEKAKGERKEPPPVPLRTKADQLAFVERCAGLFTEDGDAAFANGASALVKAALAILGVDDDAGDETEQPRGFEYTDTAGKAVPMVGRGVPGGN